ncbi:hypothetical protein PV08_09309 [Exophiala spinifera]|uniref:Cytochrome b561 domain-containing protein n=1 Tax=Exophiala spinifera TaxID=91928 RepID=A0A0D2B037_9EURO|nr:uncharacterized protein PV08_09309 [Exophiala spinifera]KIW12035.1 hypothetical protein PV08_09309 [Exophiala spinifera]
MLLYCIDLRWHVIWLLIQASACSFVQFYEKSSRLGFALSTLREHNGSPDELLFQLRVPSEAGWGAVGTGDKMDGSLMFILYASDNPGDATKRGHDTPEPSSKLSYNIVNASNDGVTLTADIKCLNCTRYSRNSVDIASSAQPWIWAIGPGDPVRSSSQDADIKQHSHDGVFFTDMTKSVTMSSNIPSISGTSNIHATAQPGYINDLVILHAVLLGLAFVIAFPLGTLTLRAFRSFTTHWIVQLISLTASSVGFGVAIALSILGIEWRHFSAAHQIIGIVVIVLALAQGQLGYWHHMQYKKLGKRTSVSYMHIALGRGVIWLGMVNLVLGFLLDGSTAMAAGAAVVSVVVVAGMEAVLFWNRRRLLAKSIASSTTDLPLTVHGDPAGS